MLSRAHRDTPADTSRARFCRGAAGSGRLRGIRRERIHLAIRLNRCRSISIAPTNSKRSLEGARALFNTYWIRFPYGGQTFDSAVANTRIMLDAATAAGVRKFVHISVTKATESSPLPYFRGKAMVEAAVKESALSYAIIRPALIFGVEDILLNNIAWLLRRFPFFAIPGRGDYRVQPIFAGDLGEIAVNAARDDRSATLDAVGPEIFTFDELVRMIASAVGSNSRIVHVDPRVAVAFASDCRMVRARRYAHPRRSSRPDEQSAGYGFNAKRLDALQ